MSELRKQGHVDLLSVNCGRNGNICRPQFVYNFWNSNEHAYIGIGQSTQAWVWIYLGMYVIYQKYLQLSEMSFMA